MKFKGEICCGGHLAIAYGGKLLYRRIFSLLSQQTNLLQHELSSHMDFRLSRRGNDKLRKSGRMIAPNPEVR